MKASHPRSSTGRGVFTEVLSPPGAVAVIELDVDVVRADARQEVPRVRSLGVCPHRVCPGLELILGLTPLDRPFLHRFHKGQAVSVVEARDVACIV